MKLVEVTLKLPERLVSWLNEFAKHIGMTPDQFIATILEYYYDAWLVGRASKEKENRERRYCVDFDSYSQFARKKRFVKNFVEWVCKNNLELDESSVRAYLDEYVKGRTLKPRTIQYYKEVLMLFVKKVKELNSSQ